MNNCIDEYSNSIVRLGQAAYWRNQDTDQNPYDHGTPEHELWLAGYKQEEDEQHYLAIERDS